jgi:hypothetical protein
VKIPESTKSSLSQRLSTRAGERWPVLSGVKVRFRSGFAYVEGQIGEEVTRLFRLRYAGSASRWGFAMYRASHDDYEESFLATGVMGGSPEETLDCACGLYLSDPSAWITDLG